MSNPTKPKHSKIRRVTAGLLSVGALAASGTPAVSAEQGARPEGPLSYVLRNENKGYAPAAEEARAIRAARVLKACNVLSNNARNETIGTIYTSVEPRTLVPKEEAGKVYKPNGLALWTVRTLDRCLDNTLGDNSKERNKIILKANSAPSTPAFQDNMMKQVLPQIAEGQYKDSQGDVISPLEARADWNHGVLDNPVLDRGLEIAAHNASGAKIGIGMVPAGGPAIYTPPSHK